MKIYITFIALISLYIADAQEPQIEILEKLIITEVKYNGEDISQRFLKEEANFSIYIIRGSNKFHFAQVLPKSKILTYGVMTDISSSVEGDLSPEEQNYSLSFKWTHRMNKINEGLVVSDVEIIKEDIGGQLIFKAIISTSDIDRYIYRGYMVEE